MTAPGAFIFGCQGPGLTDQEAAFFRAADPFGFILFARNIETPDQLRRLTGDLRAAVGREAPILIDQEGGRVQRMGPPHWRQWLPALEEVAAAGPQAARVMYLRYRIIAAELRAVGIDCNCAPLADVVTTATHPVLKNRCYAADPARVTELARAVAEGLLAGGVLPVIKHIPGHGRATVDSHLEPPRTTAPLDQLAASDFQAFTPFGDLPMGMSCHVIYDALDPARPGTLSPAVQRHVRDALGFGGLLMTDDISMEALSGPVEARSAAALEAGIDVVLHCDGALDEMAAIAERCDRLSGPALRRATAALAQRGAPDDVDISALEAEFAALTGMRADG